jgi:VWFA-related protein
VRGAPEVPQAAFQEEVGVSWILVPVTVKNRRGHVRGLDRDDFELRVDGKRTRFDDFEARGEVPWSIVFLQDLSGSMALAGKLEQSKRAVASFLDRARPGDEFALASFAGEVTAIDVPFTENQRPLRETVEKWEAYGKTALHDAVSLLPQITGDSRNVKRAVIVITDGADNASRIPPNQAREIVRRAQLPVYVLGLESGDPYAVSAEGEKLSRYADVLNLLAQSTGGRYLAVEGAEELGEACASIAEELRWQYVLGFDTVPGGASRFRTISVTVAKRGVEVAFRRGYRGTAPKS